MINYNFKSDCSSCYSPKQKLPISNNHGHASWKLIQQGSTRINNHLCNVNTKTSAEIRIVHHRNFLHHTYHDFKVEFGAE